MIYFEELAIARTMTIPQWIDIAAPLGLQGTEVHSQMLESYQPRYLDQVRQSVEEAGLRVSQFTSARDFVNPDHSARERELDKMRREIDASVALGAPYYRVTAGQEYPDLSYERAVEHVVECFLRGIEYADSVGVVLAYENHYKDYFWDRPDFSQRAEVFLDIVSRMRGTPLRINFDCGNQVMIGEDPIKVLRKVSDLVVHVHASDRRVGEYRHEAAGEGDVDFVAIFSLLQSRGYDGWISVEYNGTEGLDGLRRALAAVPKLWNEAQEQAN